MRTRALMLSVALIACGGGGSTTTDAPATSTTRAATTTIPATTTTAPGVDGRADLVFVNAQVVIVDDAFTVVEGVAMADGVIVATGSSAEMMALAGPDTLVVDLAGRTVVPGFVEPHTHLMQFPAPDLDGMRAGHEQLLASGITTAGMPTVFPDQLEAFRQLDAAGEIRLRAHAYLSYNTPCGELVGGSYLEEPFDRDSTARFAVAGVKVFADGGVCGGPAVSIPYLDSTPEELYDAGWVDDGDLYVTAEEVADVLTTVDALGGQTVIHAIGDRAIETALRGVRLAGDLDNPRQIHHLSLSSLLDADLLELFGDEGLIPVVQTMPWARACEPGRTELWQSIMPPGALSVIEDRRAIAAANPGIRFAWHGDGPFIPGGPLQQMFSLVTTGAADGSEVCYPEAWADRPTTDIEEALRMTTINAAAAMGFEDHFGSIEIGKAADLAILAHDILDPDPEVALAWNHAVATIVDGVVEFCLEDLCDLLAGSTTSEPPASTGACVAPPAGLVAWWPGDGSAADVVGDADGSLIDGAAIGEGLVGESFDLGGGAIVIDGPPSIGGGFTIEGWVRLDGAGFDDFQSIFNNDRFFLRKNDASEGNGFAAFVKLADGSVEPRAQSGGPAQAGVWTHVAATWDGTDLRIYVDGVLEGTATRSGALVASSTPWQIGRGEQEGVDGPTFVGQIDEFSLYGVALTAGDIAAIHAAGAAGKCR